MNSFWQYEFIDVIVFTQEISIFPFNQSRSTRNIFFPCNESRNTSNFVRGITPTNTFQSLQNLVCILKIP